MDLGCNWLSFNFFYLFFLLQQSVWFARKLNDRSISKNSWPPSPGTSTLATKRKKTSRGNNMICDLTYDGLTSRIIRITMIQIIGLFFLVNFASGQNQDWQKRIAGSITLN